MTHSDAKPLRGLRVLDFGHTVMGPSCTMVLADLGAEVIKIEPAPAGDPTRNLRGFGQGYFGYFNRNKRSLSIDLKTPEGHEIVRRLLLSADIVVENFAPGTMERLGLGYDAIRQMNPRIIFASLKGFLDGPYRERLALDEIVQMMSGLAYMTGPTGRPLRAGTSVIDIAGGMFGVIGILLALRERESTGNGQKVETALFETAVFLMGQHLCYAAQSDKPIPPMPERVSAWAVYDLFTLADGTQMFVGITTDQHWKRFCATLDRDDLASDESLATNNQRIKARDRLMPQLRKMFLTLDTEAASELCLKARIPFASVARPEDLFNDPHLKATNGLLETILPGGIKAGLPRLPIVMETANTDLVSSPPQIGEDSDEILLAAGYSRSEIERLIKSSVIYVSPTSSTEEACAANF
ncbi:CoA transferase [Aureimonas fodinaquatilis]|uniref:CoA transferase n=1 Tax=Aureimonas fodinaquatilis TaxID=2565783 RepID=A0A5B0DRN8_9HYPH|nr:CaiB/BaiF CoA-transferase family protein [Aureimonas fodinaquatilis]KAA0968210.1 CoA transferase [Aureimonas fodinaquatilis]